MSKFLDLRDKIEPQIVVVEKVIMKPRSFKGELFRVLAVIFVVSISVWGISMADNLSLTLDQSNAKPFSAMGIVTGIATSTIGNINIAMDSVNGSDENGNTSYFFDATNVSKIETSDYAPLTLGDIAVGDKIIVQGSIETSVISAKRIISFSSTSIKPVDVATSTATTTPEVIASSTDASSTLNVVSTSTPDTSTSTPEVVASSTDDSASSTILDNVVNSVQNTIQNVVDTLTGGTTTPDPVPPTPDPEPQSPPADAPPAS